MTQGRINIGRDSVHKEDDRQAQAVTASFFKVSVKGKIMKLTFKIDYYTRWGQQLYVVGNIPELGNGDEEKAFPLQYAPREEWSGSIETKDNKPFTLRYRYIVKESNGGETLREWGGERTMKVGAKERECVFIDAWNSISDPNNTFTTTPFTDVLLRGQCKPCEGERPQRVTHEFSVKAPLLTGDEAVCIIGNCQELGEWRTENPLLMDNSEFPTWKAGIDASSLRGEIHYKYGIYNRAEGTFRCFEEGPDRIVPAAPEGGKVVVTDTFIRTNGKWRGAGVGIPMFSLRSHRSFGCGDFTDFKLMADWAAKAELKLIQVLPLNDTTGTHTEADVLPYAAISAFALNPLFMDIERLPLSEGNALRGEYARLQPELNAKAAMDYMSVINFKLRYIAESYRENKTKFLKDKAFKAFYKENEHWLKPYAVYCCLRDKNGTCDYRQWGEYSRYTESMADTLSAPTHAWFDDIAVWWYAQFHLHIQLREAVEYAHTRGVVVKGDIPIGVNANSVDTWVAPELFHMDMQAGAPPDMFAVKGQNWALPTYNWEEMERTGYDWWKRRFRQMAHYFDAFRIDHILGFFRIWQIPMAQEEGIMGYLNPSVPLSVEEFEKRGVWFDYERFTKPYITDEILWNNFGEEADWVRKHCLYIEYGFAYRLKPEYSSQKEVRRMYEEGLITERVKWGLYYLISNVLLFEVPGSGGRQYYPRFGLQTLPTYAALDERQKRVFDELYVDYFYRRQDSGWYHSGMKKLSQLKAASNMLICGEDLGMMTHCVTAVMNELSILSLEVQRAPKTDKKEFFHPADAPYLSVVTPSTHDMSTIRGWWEEDREVTRRFYNNELGHWGEAPYFAEWWVCRDIVLQHLYSPAMWSIFQWQDLMSISPELRRENPHDERINVPSDSLKSWRYRMHIALEELIGEEDFNSTLKNYIAQSGR